MGSRIAALLTLGACSYNPTANMAGPSLDGGPDTQATPDGAVTCTWSHHFDCTMPEPANGFELTDGLWNYDTSTGTLMGPLAVDFDHFTITQSDGTTADLIVGASVHLTSNAVLGVFGDKPLIIASWSTISIEGTIDVSSARLGTNNLGPGANPADCTAHAAGTPSGKAGGGGGGFGTAGGTGGSGGTAGGTAASPPATVRGGCAGSTGGTGGGAGGAGGGAVQLTAQLSIAITGTLNAGGAGADGGPGPERGGGGGGSGGYLGFEAPQIDLAGATIAANGGGGGGGSDTVAGLFGNDATPDENVAAGGLGGGAGGDGGPGAARSVAPGNGTNGGGGDGGGGGGGSVGYVIVYGTVSGTPTVLSPSTTPGP